MEAAQTQQTSEKRLVDCRRHDSNIRSSAATTAEEGLVNGEAGETLDPDVAAEEARVCHLPSLFLLSSHLPVLIIVRGSCGHWINPEIKYGSQSSQFWICRLAVLTK